MTRIQKLAEQAKKSVPQGILTPDKWIEEYNKIFAQLIITDVTDILSGYRGKVTWLNEEQMHQNPIYVIQKHFGVNHE